MIGKKADTGKLITWLVGVVIVFFAAIIFLVSVSYLATQKVTGGDGDEIVVDSSKLDLRSGRMLLDILNDEISPGHTIKDEIKLGGDNRNDLTLENELRSAVDKKLESLDCEYLFSIEYDLDRLTDDGKDNYRITSFGDNLRSDLIESQEGVSFYQEGMRIRTKFYLGECKNE